MAARTQHWPKRCSVPRIAKPVPRSTWEDLERGIDERPPLDDRLVHQVRTEDIRPSQRNLRKKLGAIEDLAESIRTYGLLQPLVVRRAERHYELVAGHRRFEAIKLLNWAQVPALVRDESADDAYLLTLTENLQRVDLSPKEEAVSLEVLVRERGWSVRKVAEAIKRNPMYVSRRLRVFEDPVLAGPVLANALPVSTAEEILRAEPSLRRELVQLATDQQWGQTQARRAVSARCSVTLHPAHNTSLLRQLDNVSKLLADMPPQELTQEIRELLRRLVDQVNTLDPSLTQRAAGLAAQKRRRPVSAA